MALAVAMTDPEIEALVHGVEGELSRRVGRPMVGQGQADETVVEAVRWLLREPGVLSRGDFATTVERLSDNWANAMREAVSGSPPYNDRWASTDVWCTVRNDGPTPYRIVRTVRVRPIPVRVQGPGGSVREVSDAHRVEEEAVSLAPGEEIELSYARAVGALRRYSWDAMQLDTRAVTSQSPAHRQLREVAYRAEWRTEAGDTVRVDSRETQPVPEETERPARTRRRVMA